MSDDRLLEEINVAVKAVNEAEQNVTTAQAELVTRSKKVGLLLLEAKKQHPKVKEFEAFLKKVDGLKLSRAYDLLRLAGGRTTDEQIRQETKERVRKHREKKKLPKPDSVTSPPVTEKPAEVKTVGNDVDPAASAEQRKAEAGMSPAERAAKESARNLAEFIVAARMYLPKITAQADRETARKLVAELLGGKKAAA
jgi:hypothetical protein